MSAAPTLWHEGMVQPFTALARRPEPYELACQLVRAARENDPGIIAELVAAGAPVDIVLWGSSTSLLAHTLGNNRLAAAQALLDAGADPTFPTRAATPDGTATNRLAQASHALDRCARTRRWALMEKLLAATDPAAHAQDPTSRMDWQALGTTMILNGAPLPLLRRLIDLLEPFPRLSLTNPANEKLPDLIESAALVCRPDPATVDFLLDSCQRFAPCSPHPQGLLLPPAMEPDTQAWAAVITRVLAYGFPREYPATSSGMPRPTQGRGLSRMIQRWHAVAAPRDPAGALAQVKQWAASAIEHGHAPLLRRTLLPLLPAATVGPGTLQGLLEALLDTYFRMPECLAALQRHFGRKAVDQGWQTLSRPKDLAWQRWLARPGAGDDAGTLELAQALVGAGVPLPSPPSRSWLQDCFSTGVNINKRFAGPRGLALLDLLISHGADPFFPNLSNLTPADVLASQARPPGDPLGGARGFLEAHRLGAALPAARPGPAPRRL